MNLRKHTRFCLVLGRLLIIALLVGSLAFPLPAAGLTIKEEKEMSREFMKMVDRRFQLIRDPAIVDYVNSVGRRILKVVPPQPFKFGFFVIKEEVYNAFASPAGQIFIYSGLLQAMENEDELAGILAHEIGHVVSRHLAQRMSRQKKISMASLAGMVAGVFLGAVAGSSALGSAVTMGTQAAGQSAMLSFSRGDEIQADQLGILYMTKAGYDGRGMITMLRKIRARQWFGSNQVPSYLMTHPASEERLMYLGGWLASHKQLQRPAVDNDRFRMMHARLEALYGDPDAALTDFRRQVKAHPDDAVAQYGYALALVRAGNRKAATEHFRRALDQKAFDPDILVSMAKNYMDMGNLDEAMRILKGVASIAPRHLEGLYVLGKLNLEYGRAPQAIDNFKAILKQRHGKGYRKTLMLLGKAYDATGNQADAFYYLGLYYAQQRDLKNAMFQLERALAVTEDADRREKIEDILHRLGKARAEARRKKKEGQEG